MKIVYYQKGLQHMTIRAGEILISQDGQYYRVLDVAEHCVSLMRVSGQTIFACRPEFIDLAYSRATPQVSSLPLPMDVRATA